MCIVRNKQGWVRNNSYNRLLWLTLLVKILNLLVHVFTMWVLSEQLYSITKTEDPAPHKPNCNYIHIYRHCKQFKEEFADTLLHIKSQFELCWFWKTKQKPNKQTNCGLTTKYSWSGKKQTNKTSKISKHDENLSCFTTSSFFFKSPQLHGKFMYLCPIS